MRLRHHIKLLAVCWSFAILSRIVQSATLDGESEYLNDCRLSREDCRTVCIALDLDEKESAEAFRQFAEYSVQVDNLESDLSRRLAKHRPDSIWQELYRRAPGLDASWLASRSSDERKASAQQVAAFVASDEFRALNDRAKVVGRHIQQARAECRAHGDRLLESIADIASAPIERRASTTRLMRRKQHQARISGPATDFVRVVDILALVEHAGLDALSVEKFLSPKSSEEFQFGMAGILYDHEVALDAVILHIQAAEQRREAQLLFPPGSREYEELETELASHWRAQFEVANSTYMRLCDLLATHVKPAVLESFKESWLYRLCPQVASPPWLLGLVEWLSTQPNVPANLRDSCSLMQSEFRARWTTLRDEAVASGIVLHSHRLPDNRRSRELVGHLRDIYRIHQLSRQFLMQLWSVLPPDLQTELVKSITSPSGRFDVKRAGPVLDSHQLSMIGADRNEFESLPPITLRSIEGSSE